MSLPEEIVHLADLYCAATGLSRKRVSTLAMNGGHRLDRLAEGGDVQSRTHGAALQWFSDNWPDDTDWPAHIHRPVPSADATDAADLPAGALPPVSAPAGAPASAKAGDLPSLGVSSPDLAGASSDVPALSEDAAE